MTQILDGYAYPLDPQPGGSGVRCAPARADVATFAGNVSLYWDAVWPDTRVRQTWAQMTGAQYRVLEAKYLANGGGTLYAWAPGSGQAYRVEIVALEGHPYKADTYTDVTLVLKVHEPVG
jgi:hypothetical protein